MAQVLTVRRGVGRFMWVTCVLFCAVGAGCSGYRDPVIMVRNVDVTEVTDHALTLRITMDLINHNHEPLKLLNFDYQVEVNNTGRAVYSGTRSAEATLASDSQRQLEIPAVVPYSAAGWTKDTLPASFRYSIKGDLQYVTPGEIAQILFDTGVRKPRAKLAGAGTVIR